MFHVYLAHEHNYLIKDIYVIWTLITAVVVFDVRLQVVCAILAPPVTVSADSWCLEGCHSDLIQCMLGCSSTVCQNDCFPDFDDCKALC